MKRIKFLPVGKTNEDKYKEIWDAIYNGRIILIKIEKYAKKGMYVLEIEGSPCSCNRGLKFEYYYRNYSHDTIAVLDEDINDQNISFWEELEE